MDLAIQICTEFQLDLLDLEIDIIQILLFLLFLYGGDGGASAEKGAYMWGSTYTLLSIHIIQQGVDLQWRDVLWMHKEITIIRTVLFKGYKVKLH